MAEEKRTLPPAGIAVIPRGRVLTRSGIIIAPPDFLIEEVAQNFLSRDPFSNQIFLALKLPLLQRVRGSVAVITSQYASNYFHWLFDTLPRLQLIADAEAKYDWLVVPQQARFQQQSLQAAGLEKRKFAPADALHIEAAELIVPTLPGLTGNPPSWACEFLRKTFLIDGPPTNLRKIYISRWKCGTRKVVNEIELLASLRAQGFERVFLEDLSFTEQVNLFANAAIIVGAHGAGLSNLVFCRPGTGVVELFSPGYVRAAYWALCDQVSLNYNYVIGNDPTKSKKEDPAQVHANMKIDIAAVHEAILSVTSRSASAQKLQIGLLTSCRAE